MKGLTWRIVPMVIWILAIWLLGSQLTVGLAVFAGILGCAAAFIVGARLAASKVRLWVPWVLVLPLQALILALSGVLRSADLTAQILGPSNAYVMSAVVLWFCSCALWVGLFQTSSRRFAPFVALESAAITLVGAVIFAQHRDGAINRPFFLVDPLWAQGYDPLPIFLAIGGGIASVLILLLASKSAAASRRSTILDVSLVMVIMLLLFVFFPSAQIKNLRDLQMGGQAGEAKPSPSVSDLPSPAPGSKGGKGSPDPNASGSPGSDASPDPKGSPSNDANEMRDDDFSKKQGSQGNAPVAVVLLHDDYTPPSGMYYFRQTVFSEFNGKRVVRDNGTFDKDVADGFPAERPVELPVMRAPSSVVRSLDTTVALIQTHTRPFGLVNPTQFTSMDNPDPTHFQRAYEVQSDVLTVGMNDLLSQNHRVGNPAWDKDTLAHYMAAPSDPRYAQLASTCVDTFLKKPELKQIPLARALACKVWLEKNGTYDLTSKYEHSPDPVGDFLFGDRVGYCVSFAHAAVALYRTVGVPARVGTGYAVDARFRGNSSSLLIRSNASHAWPEVYVEGIGWIVLDVAPEKSLVKPSEPTDSSQQDMIGDLARKKGKMPDKKPAAQGDMQKLMRQLLGYVAWGLLWGLVLCFVGLYVMKTVRRVQPRFAEPRDMPRLAYRGALDALADMGHVRRYGESREDFARKVADVSPAMVQLTHVHLQDALGKGETRLTKDQVLDLYSTTLHEVDAHTPPLRRFLGWLNPFGWWMVK